MVVAEIAARKHGLNVLILDKRDHIGGNAYSYVFPNTKIEVHKYGTHIFHTNNERIYSYLTRFTQLNSYTHVVFAVYNQKVYSLPINLHTLSQFYGSTFTPSQAKSFFDRMNKNQRIISEESFKDKAIRMIGSDLYQAFIEGYTKKQWEIDPADLPSETFTRLPVRLNYDNRYFSDKYQGIPVDGYTAWFQNMLNNIKIKILLNADYFELQNKLRNKPIVFTGPIDKFYNYRFGVLKWRTLDFNFEVLGVEDFQGTSVLNYSDYEISYTRIHEFKHLHPERPNSGNTVIAKEFSRIAGIGDDPYYPVNTTADQMLYKKYQEVSRLEKKVHFGGRLGTYKYLDMHMAIGSALNFMENNFLEWYNKSKNALLSSGEK